MLNKLLDRYHKQFPEAPLLIFGFGCFDIPEEVKIRLLEKALREKKPLYRYHGNYDE